jgi:hypothetical protein
MGKQGTCTVTRYTGMSGLSIENFRAVVDQQPNKDEEYAHATDSHDDRACPDAANASNAGGNNDVVCGGRSPSQNAAITVAVVEDAAELEDAGGEDDDGVDGR